HELSRQPPALSEPARQYRGSPPARSNRPADEKNAPARRGRIPREDSPASKRKAAPRHRPSRGRAPADGGVSMSTVAERPKVGRVVPNAPWPIVPLGELA